MSIHTCSYYCERPECVRAQRDELRQKLEQAEKQEPALWFIQYTNRHELLWSKPKWVQEGALEIKPFYAAPVHAVDMSQERVDETAKDRHIPDGTIPISNGGIATRTPTDFFSPPKREWVGLTDEAVWLEYQQLWPFHPAEEPTLAKDIAKFARAIEAKLKEKNT